MRTEQRVLTRKLTSKQHHETLIIINWEGVTPEQMMRMAQWAVIHEIQARYAKGEMEIPEKELVEAKKIAEDKPLMLLKFSPPPPKPIKIDPKLLDVFKELSKEELDTLFGGAT